MPPITVHNVFPLLPSFADFPVCFGRQKERLTGQEMTTRVASCDELMQANSCLYQLQIPPRSRSHSPLASLLSEMPAGHHSAFCANFQGWSLPMARFPAQHRTEPSRIGPSRAEPGDPSPRGAKASLSPRRANIPGMEVASIKLVLK